MKIVLGLIGEKGGGKETFTEFLREFASEKTVSRIRSSDILAETLKLWDIELTRRNLQDLAIFMDNGFGKGTLTHAVENRMRKDTADIVIFDGVRWETDVTLIRSFERNFLVYITADLKVRFERLRARKEKVREGALTYEQFLKEEQILTETLIPKLAKQADVKIVNNGTFEEFKKEVEKFYRKISADL